MNGAGMFHCGHTEAPGSGWSVVESDYPMKTVRMIEPFGAGGGPDIIARAISPKLSELWGKPVTVENHPGAGLP